MTLTAKRFVASQVKAMALTSFETEPAMPHPLYAPLVRTPLFRLPRLSNGNTLHLKLECFQMTGSIKGRTAEYLLRSIDGSGQARPGDVVVDSSSGNNGVALAEIGPKHGYRVAIVADPKLPAPIENRIRQARAEIIKIDLKTDPSRFLNARLDLVRELSSRPGHHWTDQYSNPAAQAAHYISTGPEIWEQARGKVDVFVAAVSTGGTISGVGRVLKARRPSVRIIGVDIPGSVIFGYPPGPRRLNGIGASVRVPNVDLTVIDGHVIIDEEEAVAAAHAAARKLGLFVGGSSGAVLAACGRILAREKNLNLVALLADSGANYVDTIYNHHWIDQHGFAWGI